MSKARWADGLRKGSTKTKTYSTLPTRKEGRVQIIKDRVYDVANPQSDAQMLQRVCFATASSAAAKMLAIISISQEGESNPEYARQLFVSQNTDLLKKAAYKRVGLARHYRAAYAPKGNQQLIPNSYQVSKGSLTVPEYLVPKTDEGGSSFENSLFAPFGKNVVNGGVTSYDTVLGRLSVGSTYSVSELWRILFGLMPGDQVSVPQIYGEGIAQALYAGADESSTVEDKTINTSFFAPRFVLLSEMPSTSITISANTTDVQIQDMLTAGVSVDNSFSALYERLIGAVSIDEVVDNVINLKVDDAYDNVFGMGDVVGASGKCRAIGVILSRLNSETGKWQYSTSNLVCVWDFISQNSGDNYFGFTIDNAIATYRASVVANANGNFLQRGGTPDIVPASFR